MPRLAERPIGAKVPLAVLPVASIENHGVLPLGSDILIAECVVARLEARLGSQVYSAPAVPYSTAVEHEGAGYTVSVRPPVFVEYLYDVIRGLYGVARNIIVAVFHGGAYSASFLAARMAKRSLGAHGIAVYNFWDSVLRAVAGHGVRPYPVHADPLEASVLLACGHSQGVEERGPEEVIEYVKARARELRAKTLPPWLGEEAGEQLYPL